MSCQEILSGATRYMIKKLFSRSAYFMSLSVCAVYLLCLTGCGGGAVIPQSVTGPGALAGPQENPDNNLFIIPPGHPNRIVFESDREGTLRIYAMNPDGSNVTVVADKPSSSDTIGAPQGNRIMQYSTPAVTSDGYKVYFSNDYFATATSVLSTSITGGAQTLVKRYGEIYLEDPAVSWDGKKLAFVGYTSTPVTVAVPADEIIVDMKSPLSYLNEFVAAAQFALHPSGWQITTNAYKDNTTLGITIYKADNPTSCPVPGEVYTPVGGTATESIKYDSSFLIAPLGKIGYTDIVGMFFCINLDNTNYILVEVKDFFYPITKDLKKSCLSNADCPGSVACGNAGRCIDKNGIITYDPCTGADDCETGLCNTEMLCALDEESALASITIDWTWIQKGYTDTTTLTEKFDDDAKYGRIRWGAGMNFIGNFDNKRMDLYTMDADGTNFVQQTDDLDADRYPCFSPASSNYVYFTKAVLDEGTQNVDKPVSSAIKRLNISTGEIETVLSTSYLVKECAFSPSGTSFLFSAYNGTNFDIRSFNITSTTSSFFADTGGNDVSPTYSPDGKYFAFQSDYTGSNDIYVTDISRNTTVNLTGNRPREYIDSNPSWTP